MRRAFARAAFALGLAYAPLAMAGAVAARADSAEHPRIPSHRAPDAAGLYVDGIPPTDERPIVGSRVRLAREGSVLYDVHCSSCHGVDLRGTKSGPTLMASGGVGVDFYLTTGRMPLAIPGTQANHVSPHFNDDQVAALDAFVDARAARSIAIPHVALDGGRVQAGRSLFESNCEACHGVGAQGATAGGQWTALPLDRATPKQIGEAIRFGPGVMPRFTEAQLSTTDIAALATYVRYLATTPQTYGGTVMGYLGPPAEGFIGAFVGVGTLFWIVYFTGTKADGRRIGNYED